MKVLALTAIEAPFRSRLIETQFFEPLAKAAESAKGEWRLSFLSVIPIAFYLGRRNPLGQYKINRNRNLALRSGLLKKDINYRTSLTLFPLFPKQFNLRKNEAVLFVVRAIPRLILKLLFIKPDLIIARSYPAALLAYWAKKILKIPYIFDLRGMYPEESVNAGRYGYDSGDYRFWKALEKRIISEARACVAVSQPFVDHVKSISPDSETEFIPCCVDPGRTVKNDGERVKEKYGLAERFVLLHLGSFGTPGDRGLAGKYLLRFKQAKPEAVLVIASGTPAFGPDIKKALEVEGLKADDFRIYHPSGAELNDILNMGDAGLILERKMPNTKVCLSVKLGEYLAYGMPVICTPHVEGVVRLLENYRCGLVVDPDKDEPMEKETGFLKDYEALKINGHRLVQEVLSLERCSSRWNDIIDKALKGKGRG
jgi:glycosyltransferase involved in cell wall biosynthesis